MSRDLRNALAALCLVAALLSGGCAAQRYMQRGDDAWEAGRPVRAQEYYRRAISHESNLLGNEAFMAHYRHVESRAEHARARQRMEDANFEAAIHHLTLALRQDPDYADARSLLAEARQKRAEQLHGEAIEAADAGNRDRAVQRLREAEQHDPNNAEVQAALASFTRTLPALILDLQAERQWQTAAGELDALIDRDPNHAKARLARAHSQSRIGDANRAHAAGASDLNNKRLDDAIRHFESALEIWPNHRAAAEKLAVARQRLARVRSLVEEAMKLKAKRQWDSALATLDTALSLYPGHHPSQQLEKDIRRAAADVYVAEARRRLAAGDLGAAEAAFVRAAAYDRSHEAVNPGLATAAYRRGQLAERRGVLGVALLWYRHAASLHRDAVYTAAVGDTRAAMRRQIAFRLDADVQTDRGVARRDGQAVRRELVGQLDRRLPDFIELAGGDKAADYTASVTVDEFRIDRVLKSSQRRQHRFVESYKTPNPDIPKLRHKLQYAEHEAHRLEREYRHLHHLAEKAEDEQQRKRLHRKAVRARRAWQYKLKDVKHLHHELECAPPYVIAKRDAYWPYTYNVYEKQGNAAVSIRFTDPSADKVIKAFGVEKSAVDRDSTIDRPNPQIGLRDDDLRLIDDDAMADDLTDKLAEDAAEQIVDCAVRARANAFIAQASRHAADGKSLLAADARAYAALTIETVDPSRARTDFNALLDEQQDAARRAVDTDGGV